MQNSSYIYLDEIPLCLSAFNHHLWALTEILLPGVFSSLLFWVIYQGYFFTASVGFSLTAITYFINILGNT